MTRFLLVRHGQSEWNAAGRWQGQADVALTDLGRRQAVVAAGAVGPVDAIVSSDLRRASETAQLMAAELGIDTIHTDSNLRERDAGEWSGLTRAEIHRAWPGSLPDDPSARITVPANGPRPPSWEDDDRLLARATAALRRWASALGQRNVLVVTHGGVVYALEGHLGEPAGRLANLDGRWLEVNDDRCTLGPRVSLVDPDDVAITLPEGI